MTEDANEARWLTTSEVRQLGKAIPEWTYAVCESAYAGIIPTRATRFIRGNGFVENAPLPESFWWARGRDALSQNWWTGQFSTWIDQREHWRAFGVQFGRAEIIALAGDNIAESAPPVAFIETRHSDPKPRKRGPQWNSWVAHLAACVFEGAILPSSTTTEALKAVADRMASVDIEEMPRENVREMMNAVIDVLRASDKTD